MKISVLITKKTFSCFPIAFSILYSCQVTQTSFPQCWTSHPPTLDLPKHIFFSCGPRLPWASSLACRPKNFLVLCSFYSHFGQSLHFFFEACTSSNELWVWLNRVNNLGAGNYSGNNGSNSNRLDGHIWSETSLRLWKKFKLLFSFQIFHFISRFDWSKLFSLLVLWFHLSYFCNNI